MTEPKIEGTEQVPDKPEAPEAEGTVTPPAEVEADKTAEEKAAETAKKAEAKAARAATKAEKDEAKETARAAKDNEKAAAKAESKAPSETGNIGPGWEAMGKPLTY